MSDSDSDSDWVVDKSVEAKEEPASKEKSLAPQPLDHSTTKAKDLSTSFLTPDAPVNTKLDESDWLEDKSEKEPRKRVIEPKADFNDPAAHNTSLIQGPLDIDR